MFRKLHEFDTQAVQVEIDGIVVSAEAGESLASVLLRQEEFWTRQTPVGQQKRAPYCLMGVCFDCMAEVDGKPSVQTCLVTVRDGMKVVRQTGPRMLQK